MGRRNASSKFTCRSLRKLELRVAGEVEEKSENITASSNAIKFETLRFGPVEEFANLTEGLRKVVEFVITKEGKFFNDELADLLGLEPARTGPFLGKITQKLRKAGTQADGFQGKNWYEARRIAKRTLIFVRTDVMEFFKDVMKHRS